MSVRTTGFLGPNFFGHVGILERPAVSTKYAKNIHLDAQISFEFTYSLIFVHDWTLNRRSAGK